MASKNPSQPNIVFILTDDQGAWALGCSGNEDIHTPHIDLLAAKGIRFDNFFCASPVCSPARATILTGKMPSQHGVQDFIKKGSLREDAIEYLADQTGYTDVLSANGYVCGLSGKWHLGDSFTPQKGFSHWFTIPKGMGPYMNAPMIRDGEWVEQSGYITDVITDDAIDFMERNVHHDSPFYLSVHYTAPHDPWTADQHPQHLLDIYKDCAFNSCPQTQVHDDAVYRYDKEDAMQCLQGYFAAVTGIDRNVGRLMEALDALGLSDNTLVVFTSDNGFNCGHHGIWGKGNGTFSLNMFDTSVKVPMIMMHPGSIPEGKVCQELLSQYDIMPTLLDYVGLYPNDVQGLPGQSFVPILQEHPSSMREHVVVYDEYGPVRMIRSKAWKYIHRYPYGPHELYDLVHDPGETVNLAGVDTYQDVVHTMKHQLEQWFVHYADPDRDGVRQPVKGNGQIQYVGIRSQGNPSFDQNRTVKNKPVS